MAVRWVLGTFGATVFPTDGKGGSTATASAGSLHNTKKNIIKGFLINTLDTATVVEITDSAGTVLPGLTFPMSAQGATQTIKRELDLTYEHATNANLGIKLSGGTTGVATLLYEPIA